MNWNPALIEAAARALETNGVGGSHRASNLHALPGQHLTVVKPEWEALAFDLLPPRARRLIAFAPQRVSAAIGVRELVEKRVPLEIWIEYAEANLSPSLGIPTVSEWLSHTPTSISRRARRSRPVDLNPWSRNERPR